MRYKAGLITLKRHFRKKNDSHITRNPCYELSKFRFVPKRRERFLMPTTTTMMATRRETRSEFEAEDGGATKLAAENSKAFIHASDSFPRVSYTSAVASAAAAAAARTKKLPKRTKEKRSERLKEKGRERARETRNQILSFSERRSGASGSKFRGELSWNWFLFITRSLAYVVDLINGVAESEARTDSLSLFADQRISPDDERGWRSPRSYSSRARVTSSSSPCTAANAIDRR